MSSRSCSIAWPVFVARHPSARKEAVKPGDQHDQADLGQGNAQFFERDVLARFPQGQNIRCSLLHPARSDITSLGLGGEAAGLPSSRHPADRSGWSNAKPSFCRAAAQPLVNRRKKTNTQIHKE